MGYFNDIVHKQPSIFAYGSWSARRDGSDVYVDFDMTIDIHSGSYTDANYGFGIYWNNTDWNSQPNVEVNDWLTPRGGPYTNRINRSFKVTTDNSAGTVYVIGFCYLHDADARNHCAKGYPNCSLGSEYVGPGYHDLSNITVSGNAINRHNQQRNVTISGNAYASESSSLYVKIGSGTIASYFGEDSGYEKSPSFTPSSFSVSEGSSYTVTATRNHVSSNYGSKSGSKTFYTFRQPKVDALSISPSTKYSPQDKLLITWTTNSYRWGSYENNFQTTGKFNNSSISGLSQNPTGGDSATSVSHTLTESDIYAKLTNTQLNNNVSFTTPIEINRINPSAGNWTASASKDVTCQVQPVLSPSSVSATGGGTSTNRLGTTIFIQEVPTLTLDWAYSKFNGAAGIVDGYIVDVYLDTDYTTLYTSFSVPLAQGHSTASWSGTLDIDTANRLKRGVKNYFKITPYFKRPNGTMLYGTTSYYNVLKGWVLPIYALEAPIIDYPKDNSNWHNKFWRILMESPEDKDMSTYDANTRNNYRYKDIQIEVTADTTSYTFYYSNAGHNKIFSTDTLTHQKKVGVNLSLISGFINANKYTFRIRYQKNYYGDDWGIWSKYFHINNVPVTNLTLNVGQLITAEQYTYVRDASMRLYNTYPFNTDMISNNVAQLPGDQIDALEYQGIYNTVKGIQIGINNYCDYDSDRLNVSMQDIITELDNPDEPKTELITAMKNPTDKDGRNYKNILIDCMNKLK